MNAVSHVRRVVVPGLLLAGLAFAQKPAASGADKDPANLAGERVSAPVLSDTLPINHGAPALAQLLKKLRTRASLMMVVAHPDDEDGGMLTYESRGQGARVAMLTLTRGEGGQNLMSADFNDALGLIRTQELLAADRYFGTDQFFGSEVDFGFSKTREETLAQWTHERVLYDAVRAVRLYRPLVLTSVFIGGVTDGHGHHQVAGQMNQEVFEAAADPKVFPEMGLPAWAPLKVYARVPFARVTQEGMFDYATGKSSAPRFYNYVTKKWTTVAPVANVEIPEGQTSTEPGMDGLSYVQFARLGLALQKTQIGNNVRIPRPGASGAPYTRYASRIAAKENEAGFFEGIDVSLPGIATLAPDAPATLRLALEGIDGKIGEAQKLFVLAHPEATAPPLRDALLAMDRLIASVEGSALGAEEKFNVLHELRIKHTQLNNALVLAYGLTFKPSLMAGDGASGKLTAGEAFRVRADFSGEISTDITKRDLRLIATPGLLKSGVIGELNSTLSATVAADPTPTRPYFSRPSPEQPFYNIADAGLRNAPATPAPLVESLHFVYDGAPLEMRGIVRDAETNIAAVAVPAVSIELTPGIGLEPVSGKARPIMLTAMVHATVGNLTGSVRLDVPAKWQVMPVSAPLKLTSAGEEQRFEFTVLPAEPLAAGRHYPISAVAETSQGKYREAYRPAGYASVTATNIYTPAVYKATAVDVVTAPKLKIAYLPGTGDDVAMYLPNLGVTPTLIGAKDLANLGQFDAVVLGVRAYAVHPELANSQALLDYAKGGGVVIVQYNTARYGDAESPYAIEVPGDSAHNVVVEADAVTILAPGSPLMTWPNRITAGDFKGWTEELGHGFAASWDAKFEALTETHDPEQDPQKGGLLYARTGRGAYVYVAYALYRQLPEGVPGAYRILANLISLPRNAAAGLGSK